MNEEKVLITNEIKKIYSIILSIFTAILILFSILMISTYRLFISYMSMNINYKFEVSIFNIGHKEVMLIPILSFLMLVLIIPFEILSKNKKVNIIVYLVIIGIYLGMLGVINLYLVDFGINVLPMEK